MPLIFIVFLFFLNACGPSGVDNASAPDAENVVFPIEFGTASLSWRENTHRVFIGFTDDYNHNNPEETKWSVSKFCERWEASTIKPTVHMVFSGDSRNGEVPNPSSENDDDPTKVADCSGGTVKYVEPSASDLDLSSLPVTKALTGTALVEYITEFPDTESTVTIVIKTASADATATFNVKLANGASTQTVEDSVNADIPADGAVKVPDTTLNNLKIRAEFTQAEGNPKRVRVNLLGVTDPTTGETINLVANESIFISSTTSKLQEGIKVTKSKDNKLPVDLAFIVDNSGSMAQEADKIAEKISDFTAKLSESGIDAKFAVLGFSFGGISGGLDLTDANGVKSYLDRESGTDRTGGFEGANGGSLKDKAGSFDI